MYSILVADDEKIGRKGVHFLLDQMDEELDIIEAKNGKEALKYIQNHHLDILLTDIKMPFLDGIELIKEALKVQPHLKIAIFSGYSDFEYAKNALSLGVLEYILKPVNPEEFKTTIKKVIGEVDKLHESVKQEEAHEELLKEHILYNLVNGNSIEVIRKQLSGHNFNDFIPPYTRVLLLEFDGNFFGEVEEFEEKLKENVRLTYEYLNLNLSQSVLFFEEENIEKLNAVAHDIYNFVQVKYHRNAYIAISEKIEDIGTMSKVIEELEDTLEGMYYHPDKHIYSELDEIEEVNGSPYEDIEKLTNLVKHDIHIKDIESLRKDFNSFYDLYNASNDFTNDYIKFLFSGMIKDIYEALTHTDEKELDQMIVKFYRANDFKSMKQVMDQFVALLEKEFKKSESLSHGEIKDVMKYVYNHYNLDLSVDYLADQVCLAPSYLSHIFKKETGENLGKFIKRVRMEKAKDMLENTHERIVAIAVAVGYSNVSYFCQSFREYYGISPQKYRNQGEA